MSKYANIDEALYDVPTVHLTLTGVEAGRPLCDCDKQSELQRGCLFFHAIYAPEKIFNHSKLCVVCKSEWEAAI